MGHDAVAWAARQYFGSSDEQLAAFVLAEMADCDGRVRYGEARLRLGARSRLTPARLEAAILGLWRAGALEVPADGPAARLMLERDFDARRDGERAA